MTTVRISLWNGGQPVVVGCAEVEDDYPVRATADEAGGIASLIADAKSWTGPAGYECTGDETYETTDNE
jgi:hypothetical protein